MHVPAPMLCSPCSMWIECFCGSRIGCRDGLVTIIMIIVRIRRNLGSGRMDLYEKWLPVVCAVSWLMTYFVVVVASMYYSCYSTLCLLHQVATTWTQLHAYLSYTKTGGIPTLHPIYKRYLPRCMATASKLNWYNNTNLRNLRSKVLLNADWVKCELYGWEEDDDEGWDCCFFIEDKWYLSNCYY